VLAQSFAATAPRRDLLGRALLFRLVAEQLAVEPRQGAHLEPYRRVLSAVRRNWPTPTTHGNPPVADHFDATATIVEFWQRHAGLP
jgi:hypothetical protein